MPQADRPEALAAVRMSAPSPAGDALAAAPCKSLSAQARSGRQAASMRAQLGLIVVFPIKALDGVAVEEAAITAGGILEHDRVYAIVDAQGKAVNGKRNPRVHRLGCRFDPKFREVAFAERGSGSEARFALAEPGPLTRWLSDFFGAPVSFQRESKHGFPDDHEAFGPTVASRASLAAVAGWFPNLNLESARRRFRTNLELDGPELPAFWEDRLYGAAGELRPFRIGEVAVRGHNPCQRCVVPTRDPDTAEATAGFQIQFAERRRDCLPPWADRSRFNHFYRFAVNTSILPSEAGKRLRMGDGVELIPPSKA